MNCVTMKVLPHILFFVVGKKKNRFDGLQYKQDQLKC